MLLLRLDEKWRVDARRGEMGTERRDLRIAVAKTMICWSLYTRDWGWSSMWL
jgi:hypothetical protein